MGICLRRLLGALYLSLAAVVTASASYVVVPHDRSENWEGNSPNIHAPSLGECFGNCGGGCSDSWNPGCGGNQYWQLQILSDPQSTGYRKGEFLCYSGSCYYYEYERVQAMGRWTYHGYATYGCIKHDSICPEFLYGLGCVWWEGCGSGWNQTWSYDAVVLGWQPVYFAELGPDA